MLKICVTGHRDLLCTDEVRQKIAYSFAYFKKTDANLLAMSSVAAGADTLFAREALLQNIPLKIVIPFDLQNYKTDFKGYDLQQLEAILAAHPYETAFDSAGTTEKERNNAYLQTGKLLVDQSDIVLAIWDGKPATGTGGTGDIVEYARATGKELHIITGVRTTDGEQSPPDEIQATFDKLDEEAKHYKKNKFEPAWITGIITGLLAVFLVAPTLSFPDLKEYKFYLSAGELIFLSISFLLLAVFAKKWKREFLIRRRGAEYLRTILWFREAGIPIPKIDDPEYSPGDKILAMERQVSSGLTQIENLPNAKRMTWILAQEQIDYHQQTRIDTFTKKNHKAEKWLNAIKIIFVSVVVLTLLIEAYEHSGHHSPEIDRVLNSLKFLWIILPPVYAALEGVKYFAEWKRNIAISLKTKTRLGKIKDKILGCNNKAELTQATIELRNILELENSDWATRYDENEIEPKP